MPSGNYIVGGGAALEAYGIRKATDVDIAVTRDVYQRLKLKGWKERTVAGGNKGLVKGRFDLAIGYMCGKRKLSTEVLLRTANFIDGVPFMGFQNLIRIKKATNRMKDQRDLLLIKEALQAPNIHKITIIKIGSNTPL